MQDREPSRRQVEFFHGLQQFRQSRNARQIARQTNGNAFAQRIRVRNVQSVSLNQMADRLAIAHVLQRTGLNSQIDVLAGLLPSAKAAGFDIGAHVLFRPAQIGELPIMNGAGPLSGQMGDPALFHEPDENRRQTVFDQMSAKGEHHRRALFTCVLNSLHDLRHCRGHRG